MDAAFLDLRYALRRLAARPGFLAMAVVTLALGIGLNSAVFSLVNAVSFRPLPVAVPDELVSVYSSVPDDVMSHAPMAGADYEDLRDVDSFADLVAYTYTPLALERGGSNRLVMGARVTANYFAVLGVEPALGRAFTGGEGQESVVLSYTAWQRRYGAAPSVIGETLRLNGRPHTVIGVAPEGFSGLTRGVSPELWLAFAGERLEGRDSRYLWVIGRLAPGASFAGARVEVATLAQRLRQEFPASHSDRSFVAVPTNQVRLLPGVDSTLHAASLLVMGGVALVLVVASANLANMLLARAAGRRREIATRLALGARASRVVRQLLTESFVLAFLGGLLGLLCALGSNAALNALRLPLPVDLALGLELDGRVFLFTLAVSTLTALAFGLAPAIEAARTDLVTGLRGGSSAAPPRRRWRGGLVVAQVALSLLLLVCAGLAVRSLENAHRIDPGFDPDGVVVATFGPRLQGYTPRQIEDFYRQLLDRVGALPGLSAAGLASHLPLAFEISTTRLAAAGETAEPDEWPRVDGATVGPGYFETLRVPLLRGRTFNAGDTEDTPRVAVVNESFAARFWPGTEAIGQRLAVDGEDGLHEVVGVVADGKYRTLGEPPRSYLYLTHTQSGWSRSGGAGEIFTGTQTLVARTDLDPPSALAAIRRAAREIDDQIAITRLTTMAEALGPTLWVPRLAASFFGLFGAVALVLAAVGIYGVTAYAVSRRTHEIGVRMALGARRRDILRLMLRDGLGQTVFGVVLGLAGALATARAFEAFLYGVSPTDWLTLTAVSSLLAAVALAACYIPARRGAGVDPLVSLRYE